MKFAKMLTSLALLAVFSVSGPASAGEGHGHDSKPLHGGVLASANDLDFELVVKADRLTLYIADHGKPVAVVGAKATATVHAGSNKTVVVLEPGGDNVMVGKGSFKTGVGVRVAATVTLVGKPETKVNFRLK